MGNLILLAGPNGSGKTTYYNQVLKEKYPDYFYVNADSIKKSILEDNFYFSNYKIKINKNELYNYFSNKFIIPSTWIDFYDKVISAEDNLSIYYKYNEDKVDDFYYMVLTTFILEKLVEQGANIIYETVFSHESKIDLIKGIKEKGYNIDLYYICTDYPLINIMNVGKRVKEGGHDVPEDKIISRYYRSLENIYKLEKEIWIENEDYINSNYKNEFEDCSYSRPYWWLELKGY